jgi:hypothetical protein
MFIPDPESATKERGDFVLPFFVATNITKLKLKNSGQFTKN